MGDSRISTSSLAARASATRTAARRLGGGARMSVSNLLCSVVVPAHGAAHLLPETLGALLESDVARESWELIVVDDGSLDETAAVAGRFADTVIRLTGRPHGPAYARNRGF